MPSKLQTAFLLYIFLYSQTRSTTTMTDLANSSPAVNSNRYQRLVDILHFALDKARSQVDVEEIVKGCYGDENVAVFQALLEGVLESTQTDVTTSTLSYFAERQVDEKLNRLDAAIRKFERDTATHQRRMEQDKASAQEALEQAQQRPEGVTAQDWVRYQAYQRLMEEKNALEVEIAAEEAAVAELEATEKEQARTTNRHVEELAATSKVLEQSADLCASIHQ